MLNLEEIRDVSEKSTPLTTQSSVKKTSFFQVTIDLRRRG